MRYTNDSRVALAASCAGSALSDFISEVSDFSESFTLFRLVSGAYASIARRLMYDLSNGMSEAMREEFEGTK